MTIVSSTFQPSGRVSRAYAGSPTHSCGSGSLNRTECTVLTLGPWNSAVGPVTPGASVSSGHLKIDLFHCLTAHPVNNQRRLNHRHYIFAFRNMQMKWHFLSAKKNELFTSWILLVPFSMITSSKVFTLAGRILMFLKASNTNTYQYGKFLMTSCLADSYKYIKHTRVWGVCLVSQLPNRSSILCWIKYFFI